MKEDKDVKKSRERERQRMGGKQGLDLAQKSIQQRKVEMRKREETDLMKRNQALNKEGGSGLVGEPVCEGVL